MRLRKTSRPVSSQTRQSVAGAVLPGVAAAVAAAAFLHVGHSASAEPPVSANVARGRQTAPEVTPSAERRDQGRTGQTVRSPRGDAPDATLRQRAAQALRRAAEFFRERVATEGGYVYYYSEDLSERWGEGRTTADFVWVQPPGTPTVGLAFVEAFQATGDEYYLDAAREAAEVLVYGRLASGGWTNAIDVSARRRGLPYSGGKRPREGHSSLDDGQTQSAIRLLVEVDAALQFREERIHSAALDALKALLRAQFANGGFPQVWTGPVAPRPIRKAKYPDYDWRTEGRIKEYWNEYTLNDNVCGYVAETLFAAHRVYGDERYRKALLKLGDFLLLAQMPEPQPGWAQQYNAEMQPIWARKFEPPAVAGDESQEVIDTLLTIAAVTGERRFLEPIPRAIAYLRRSRLPDGRLARYYELQTNRPLYMTRRGDVYTLTYDDSRLPSHYGWKVDSRLDALEQRYRSLSAGKALSANVQRPIPLPKSRDVQRIIGELDEHGRWGSVYAGGRLVGQPKFALGRRYIASSVFAERVRLLSAFLRRD